MKKELWVKDVQEEVEKRQEKEDKKATIKKVYNIVKAVLKVYSYTPPEGLFTKGPDAIAKQLKSDSDDIKQAMSRLIFYINRAGNNLTQERTNALEKAKEKLRNLYKKATQEKEAIGHPPKDWWDMMTKDIKKKQPSYSQKIVDKVVGDIWHNKMDDTKKRQLVRQYE